MHCGATHDAVINIALVSLMIRSLSSACSELGSQLGGVVEGTAVFRTPLSPYLFLQPVAVHSTTPQPALDTR